MGMVGLRTSEWRGGADLFPKVSHSSKFFAEKTSLNFPRRDNFCSLNQHSHAMNMTPRLRKIGLLAHITFSVGWFGAVVPYLALAVAGLAGHDDQMARAAYLSMNLIGWFVIVPLSLAALLSGLVQSLGTQWGLFRHWWIVMKLVLTLLAVIVLLLHMEAVGRMARMAAEASSFSADFRAQQMALLIHPSGGLLVLLAAMTLSVFKPWGMTPYGRRRASQTESPCRPSGESKPAREPLLATSRPRWARIIGFHAIGLVVLFAILHITGLHHH